ncbi:MAG: hypothetical protein ACJ8FM_08330, partial [Xanthobacteraceae bacterium]
VRMILVARPEGGLARGLITTLSNPGGMNFTPASAPLVLRLVAAQTSQLGYIHPGSQDYDRYLGELASVTPQFGGFTDVRAPSTRTNTTPDDAVFDWQLSPGERGSKRLDGTSTHFHRNLIRGGSEFESRMSHLPQALPAWNDDCGY